MILNLYPQDLFIGGGGDTSQPCIRLYKRGVK